ncbi:MULTISPECIES: hypothetical protein [Streptomyces]|uniref:hypothetical protein n=1 Tax=Streptomyces TaxID=1883 RepID=UPI0004AB1092|nr:MULTISPECIES: hypothetical protein [Streptomyces]
MPSSTLRRSARIAAIAALACATTVATAGVATADGHHRGRDGGHHGHHGHHEHRTHHRNVVDIDLEKGKIDVQDEAEGGLVTFEVETDDPAGRQIQLIRPHEGVSKATLFADLTKAVSQTPATAAQGIKAVTEAADALGGAFVAPDVPVRFTEEVDPGEVLVLDFGAFLKDPAHPLFATIEFEGHNGRHRHHRHDRHHHGSEEHGTVILEETSAGPRFDVEDVDDADAPIVVRNEADELHEMVVQPVKPGTTDADIKAFFDATAKGQHPAPPFTGLPSGLGAISPGDTATFEAKHLQPGTYVLLCFIPDDKTGVPHAFLGMHEVVELH